MNTSLFLQRIVPFLRTGTSAMNFSRSSIIRVSLQGIDAFSDDDLTQSSRQIHYQFLIACAGRKSEPVSVIPLLCPEPSAVSVIELHERDRFF
jgi:hypothetical protein